MSGSRFLYALWCLIVVGLFLASTSQGYSPFADGGRSTVIGRAYGPTHK